MKCTQENKDKGPLWNLKVLVLALLQEEHKMGERARSVVKLKNAFYIYIYVLL